MKEPGNTSAEVVLKKFDELYRKYRFMEVNLVQKKKRCESLVQQHSNIHDIVWLVCHYYLTT